MAEENQNSKPLSQSAQEAAGTVKDLAKLGKDMARIAAGDMSAIKDVVMNKTFWQILLVIGVLISFVGMIIGGSITGVLNYLATSWAEHWAEHDLAQAVESNGNLTYYKTTGWLLTVTGTIGDVAQDVWNGLSEIFSNTKAASLKADGKDNSALKNEDPEAWAAGKNPDSDDYDSTMEAILQNGDTVGLTPALRERLDMIKGRVEQRGIQLKNAVYNQYIGSSKSEYNDLANALSNKMDASSTESDGTIVMYAGFNKELSAQNYRFDTSAFKLTDLQALKILAIFSIQHDCQLTEMDMWSLMAYCGWYSEKTANEELDDVSGTIYETEVPDQRFGNAIGNVTQENMDIRIADFQMKPLNVPVWTGSCAPQWYYEQQALIREHNRQYLAYWNAGDVPEGMFPWGINQAQKNSNTYTIPGSEVLAPKEEVHSRYTTIITYQYWVVNGNDTVEQLLTDCPAGQDIVIVNLKYGTTYKIIRYALTTNYYKDGRQDPPTTKKKTIATFTTGELLTEEQADTSINIEQFDNLAQDNNLTFGIIDKLFYSVDNKLTVKRNEYSSILDENGNMIYTRDVLEAALRDENGNLNASEKDILKFWEKHIWAQEKTPLNCGGIVRRDDAGVHSFTFTGNIPSARTVQTTDSKGVLTKSVRYSYYMALYRGNTAVNTRYAGNNMTIENLQGDTQYQARIICTVTTTTYTNTYNEETGELISHVRNGTSYSSHTSETYWKFTTFKDRLDTKAYELYACVDVSFAARSVDEITFELLGIWPGSLEDTVQVVRTTGEDNLIGVNDEGEYSYCLRHADITPWISLMLKKQGLSDALFNLFKETAGEDAFDLPLVKHIYSPPRDKDTEGTDSNGVPSLLLKTETLITEYGINIGNRLQRGQTPSSGWRYVDTNGDNLVFDIGGNSFYFVYCRMTLKTDYLYSNGQSSTETMQEFFLIDRINPYGKGDGSEYAAPDTPVENGVRYADGHLGNELLRLDWTDIYTDANGTPYTLDFRRMQPYQYESYVDMVMALCELLEISYDDWDPAIQRAKELGIKMPR